jgi:hypothetical protein
MIVGYARVSSTGQSLDVHRKPSELLVATRCSPKKGVAGRLRTARNYKIVSRRDYKLDEIFLPNIKRVH